MPDQTVNSIYAFIISNNDPDFPIKLLMDIIKIKSCKYI